MIEKLPIKTKTDDIKIMIMIGVEATIIEANGIVKP